MDAYRKGLNGHQAAWASKMYRGHRVLPESILEEFDKAHNKKVVFIFCMLQPVIYTMRHFGELGRRCPKFCAVTVTCHDARDVDDSGCRLSYFFTFFDIEVLVERDVIYLMRLQSMSRTLNNTNNY